MSTTETLDSGVFLWLRNDLRLFDQPLLQAGYPQQATWVYVFDPRFLSREVKLPGNVGSLCKASARRALFLLQSVRELAGRLREEFGAELFVRCGNPEDEIPEIARRIGWKSWDVHCQRELGTEERDVQARVASASAASGGQLHASWGLQFLYHPDDVQALMHKDPTTTLVNPHHFWSDGTDPESQVPIRAEIDCSTLRGQSRFVARAAVDTADPLGLLSLPEAEALACLGYPLSDAESACVGDIRAVLDFRGGETAALARLERWIQSGGLSGYYENRSGLLGADYSSKLSPWLAAGCISPVRFYRRIRKETDSDSITWLISELGWRDLFRYHLMFHGSSVFKVSGPAKANKRSWLQDHQLFSAWCAGQTGIPYLDAHMRELAATGFMSNTGRQLVASFLSCCLGVDWRLGAMWFEAMLIDHDVSLNYGNWNREARVRWTGPYGEPDAAEVLSEEHAHFVARLQGAARGGEGVYDTAAFIRRWLPELERADEESLLGRRSPRPLYEVLCHLCGTLDRESRLEEGKLLCSNCCNSCAGCGFRHGTEAPRSKVGGKRKWYCSQCWADWRENSG